MSTLPHVSTEEVSMQSHRALIGWLNNQEAAQFLLGRQPTPTDDTAHIQQTIEECRANVASRSVFTPKNPIIDADDEAMLKAIQSRPEIHAAFAGLEWYPAMVNLREVLTFQKTINTEGLETRLAAARSSKEELLELCLPTHQSLPPTGGIVDQDGKAITFSSLNPNLRVAGYQVSKTQINPELPSTEVMAVTFLVSMGTSYLQVVHYKGRYFIRDGYHRASGLLRENIDVVPCIVINAKNFEQVVSQPQLFLPYEVLFGERPPRLVDFWEDAVSQTILRTKTRKVIRITGGEFVVEG